MIITSKITKKKLIFLIICLCLVGYFIFKPEKSKFNIKDFDLDSNNIAFGTDFVYNFDDRVSGQIGLDYILTDDFNVVAGEDDSFALTAQVNYLKGGLWSIYYTTELKADDVDDTFGFKYGVQF